MPVYTKMNANYFEKPFESHHIIKQRKTAVSVPNFFV